MEKIKYKERRTEKFARPKKAKTLIMKGSGGEAAGLKVLEAETYSKATEARSSRSRRRWQHGLWVRRFWDRHSM